MSWPRHLVTLEYVNVKGTLVWLSCTARAAPNLFKGPAMTRLPTLLATAALALPLAAAPALAQESRNLVAVVTAEHPQTQLMAMVLTTQAVAQGHAAQVLLCGPGADIALRDAPDTATAPQPPQGASPQGMLQALMAQGVPVAVCAIYLPGRGAGPEVLLDGITVAQPPAMAETMMDPNATVWSF